MTAVQSDMYLTNRDWFRAVVGGKDMILCYTSALECLELFSGYLHENRIDVYAKEEGAYANVNYRLVNDFSRIEMVKIGNLLCTSVSQTVNDMLDDFNDIDEQSLVEALGCYYFENNKSFAKLRIEARNINKFHSIKDWAVEYYESG